MKENPYIRIGVSYYKQVMKPTIHGELNETLIPWNYETISRDLKEGQEEVALYFKNIPKYDGMTCIPISEFMELSIICIHH